MFYTERYQEILDLLNKEKSITVHRLARELSASESSVRRDLTNLERSGKIRRTYGGAVLVETPEQEVSFMFRKTQNLQQKKEIAQRAACHLKDGMMIFLDASSTVAQLVPLLQKYKDITVITNSPFSSIALGDLHIRNYCTGGLLLNNSFAYVGKHAENFLEHFSADIVFFSSRGLSGDGIISDSMEEEVFIRRAMLLHARKKIFLCDQSKINRQYHYKLCSLDDIDDFISDDPAPVCSTAKNDDL